MSEGTDMATASVEDVVAEIDGDGGLPTSTPDIVEDSPVDEDVNNSQEEASQEEVVDDDAASSGSDDVDESVQEVADSLIDKLSPEEIQERLQRLDSLEEQHQKLVSNTGRMQQQYGETRKRLEEMEAAAEEARQRAEAESLSVYSRRHPDYDRWVSLHTRARADQETLNMLTGEAREQAEAAMNQKYSADERELISGYSEWLQQKQTEVWSDPDYFVEQKLQQLLPAFFQQYSAVQNEYTTVERRRDEFFSKNEDLVNKHGQELLDLMQTNPGISADVAAELVDLRHRNQTLADQSATSEERAATAKAQQEALSSKAQLPSSGPRSVPVADILEGVDSAKNDMDFIDELMKNRAKI
jgi:hypothetical protein